MVMQRAELIRRAKIEAGRWDEAIAAEFISKNPGPHYSEPSVYRLALAMHLQPRRDVGGIRGLAEQNAQARRSGATNEIAVFC